MNRTQKQKYFLLSGDLAEISSNFLMQQAEDAAKKNGLEVNIYIDTKDVIQTIQGIYSFEKSGGINIERFNSSRSTIVHGFMYRKWLKNIKILPPHQDEFLLKLSEPYIFGTTVENKTNVESDFFEKLKLDKLRYDPVKVDSFEKFKQYIVDIQGEAVSLFKADFVLKEEMSWTKRYKYLFEYGKVFDFDSEYFDLEGSEDSKFRTILSAVQKARKRVRPGRQVNLSKNNYLDALALRCLQDKLEQFENSNGSLPLPIFYASSSSLYEELKKIIDDSINFSNSRETKLLAYFNEDSQEYFPIIRSTDYFILDVIYNQTVESSLSKYFHSIKKLKSSLREDFDSFFQKDFLNGDSDIRRLTLTEFFEKVWLENGGYKELNNSILEFLQYQKFTEDVNKEKLERFLESEKASILENIPRNSKRVQLFHEIWNTLENNFKNGALQLPDNSVSNLFNDFGLTRFSFDSFTKEPENLNLVEAIKQALDGIIRDYSENDWQSLGNRISLISSYISIGVFTDYKGVDDLKKDKRYHNFLLGLSILWIFGENKIIVDICNYFEMDYPSYHVATIHASSLFLSKSPEKGSKGREILDCIESKPYVDHYKVWISLAYIYFRIWEDLVDHMEFPELVYEEEQDKFMVPENQDPFLKAVDYIRRAVGWLSINKDLDPSKETYRNQKFYYAINNYIYYVTRGGDLETFKQLMPYSFKLERARTNDYWQMRFHDTLAWFYFRKALTTNEGISEFKFYMTLAKREIDKALSNTGAKNQREKQLFEHISDKIGKVISTGYREFKFSQKEIENLMGQEVG